VRATDSKERAVEPFLYTEISFSAPQITLKATPLKPIAALSLPMSHKRSQCPTGLVDRLPGHRGRQIRIVRERADPP